MYETIEQNGLVDDLVFVVKNNNVTSEQVFKILVMATSGSADMGELKLILTYYQWHFYTTCFIQRSTSRLCV